MTSQSHDHLHVDVLFGSQSDERVFDQVLATLVELEAHPSFEVCSAHRNPDRLREIVKHSKSDLTIAGAGLSAHLPGVVAAHSLKPVIGLPVKAAMEGLDAQIATMQMPSGVPVLSCGVENYKTLKAFLSAYQQWRTRTPVVSVFAPESAAGLVAKFQEALKPVEITLNLNPTGSESSDLHVYFVDILNIGSTPIRQENAICVPYVSSKSGWDPRILLELTQQGGLWVGVDNAKNAALALIELMNHTGQYNDLLITARGGTFAHA